MQLWLRDITQAYTQSERPLQRTILAELPEQLRQPHPEGIIIVIIKLLYEIAKAGAYWWAIYFKHYCEQLNMEISTYDPCLLITTADFEHFSIMEMQTDDIFGLYNEGFSALEAEKLRFTAKDKQLLKKDKLLLFNGCILFTDGNILQLRQKNQGQKLEIVTDAQSYVCQRARGAYIATICQPMASFDLFSAAQTTDFSKENVAKLNRWLKWQMQNLSLSLDYISIELNIMKLFAFINVLFANNRDLSSQIGYIIVLGNEKNTEKTFIIFGNLVHWFSVKCKRITRSVFAFEVYAMAYGVDIAVAIGTIVDKITDRLRLPKASVVVCIDSLFLYECLIKLETIKKKKGL
jgi:hypothetical protein